MKAIFLLQLVMKIYLEEQKNLDIVFIDLEKAYGMVCKQLAWEALDLKNVLQFTVVVSHYWHLI